MPDLLNDTKKFSADFALIRQFFANNRAQKAGKQGKGI